MNTETANPTPPINSIWQYLGNSPEMAKGRKFKIIDISNDLGTEEVVASTAINLASEAEDSFSWLSSTEDFCKNFKRL